ncbi:MAG: proline--tRNA ligase [Candidatus Brennerbacteria bacterium RIFOXYD1_FULL_41_16]|uniref:Proline--tRNA ligase n=1 Tax=Candidatus Brennerbacteria bacterium RIFOXYD1_FULL_41_16 TaxID=1797529 RepID=A0A1G1XNV3_9BACT|nr:MAG: Proline-tRNA ligase [Parcubacteria group bacterium GW2011_GWB1_41_4]OGY41017.1 MAG: proline--tRNA ligase [Candidatus Brennerbacteria bacterium RIFOXYD1_FULL_41_16]
MRDITPKYKDVSKWYQDVVVKAELADYSPVKGSMVIRPYGFALWESIQKFMDTFIKKAGVKNAYFPLFIPESYLHKEKEHVEGFSPQVAVVTFAGGEELKEKLVVRPTSETIMYEMYKQWFHSWRDLPVLINQWNNVVRWEKRTYLFLRTSEFLWQEGHCAHATHEDNWKTVLWAMNLYKKTYQNLMGVYGIVGKKSQSEKFAGGDNTLTYEIMMPDGKALQGCTSHDLGQNFAKAFNWTVLDQGGAPLYPYQNSWGFSTRSIGALILAHGDDDGLIMPPEIAPVQVVIVPIYKTENKDKVIECSRKIVKKLGSFRIELDLHDDETAGFKYNKWEMKGVPVRIEIGEKEVNDQSLTLVRRDTKEKIKIKESDLKSSLKKVLEEIQNNLFEKHKKTTEENTHQAKTYDEFKKIMKSTKGFIYAFWCENVDCEEKIKSETKATTRCLPLKAKKENGKCIYCGRKANYRWVFAQAY